MILIGILFAWVIVEAQLFRVKRINIKNDKINESLHIIFISDIHYGKFYFRNRLGNIINRINKIDADVIIIGGDLLENTKTSKFRLADFNFLFSSLSRLKAKYGNYIVLGNHDYFPKSNVENFVHECGVYNLNILRNQGKEIIINNNSIGIFGTDDFLESEINYKEFDFKKTTFKILVSHNPDAFENVTPNFDLGLSGHTHGGQVNFFGLFAPFTESKYGQKYVRRINKKGKANIITSKGLGCSMLPFRFCAVPEILDIKITK